MIQCLAARSGSIVREVFRLSAHNQGVLLTEPGVVTVLCPRCDNDVASQRDVIIFWMGEKSVFLPFFSVA